MHGRRWASWHRVSGAGPGASAGAGGGRRGRVALAGLVTLFASGLDTPAADHGPQVLGEILQRG